MKTSMAKRAGAVLAAAAVFGGVMTAGASTAAAADPTVRFEGHVSPNGDGYVLVLLNGRNAGVASFKSDGDMLSATDPAPDGYGISAYLGTSPVREASTRGHNSPYTAKKGGNLPEDKKYTFWACVGKGKWQRCSSVYKVTS